MRRHTVQALGVSLNPWTQSTLPSKHTVVFTNQEGPLSLVSRVFIVARLYP